MRTDNIDYSELPIGMPLDTSCPICKNNDTFKEPQWQALCCTHCRNTEWEPYKFKVYSYNYLFNNHNEDE